jgi:hypothetical protein
MLPYQGIALGDIVSGVNTHVLAGKNSDNHTIEYQRVGAGIQSSASLLMMQ